jgi:hypothetical protein
LRTFLVPADWIFSAVNIEIGDTVSRTANMLDVDKARLLLEAPPKDGGVWSVTQLVCVPTPLTRLMGASWAEDGSE